jgi:hypothetical protein
MTVPARRLAVLALAAGQVIATPLSDFDGGAGPTPLVEPAGYAFTIWGPIVALSVAAAVDGLRPSRRRDALLDRIAVPACVVLAGYSAWLAAASAQRLWLTVVIFGAMLVALARILAVLGPGPSDLQRTAWGLYAGWTTVAVPINVAAAAVGSGADAAEPGWQAVVLAASGAGAVAGTWLTRGLPAFAGATAWGLVAAAVATAERGAPGLAALSGAAAAGVVLSAWLARQGGPGARWRGRAAGRASWPARSAHAG